MSSSVGDIRLLDLYSLFSTEFMYLIRTISILFICVNVTFAQNCPTLLNAQLVCEEGCDGVCPGKELTLIMDVLNPKDGDEYEWFYSGDPNFDPQQDEGTTLGTQTVTFDVCQSNNCPRVLFFQIDACISEAHEYMLISSGSGFNVDDFSVDFPDENNQANCPECADIGSGCNLLPVPNISLTGCSNVKTAGPGDRIPAGATVVIFFSSNATSGIDFTAFCNANQNLGVDVYLMQSSCTRALGAAQIGAFTNMDGTGTRSTTVSFCGGCSQDIIYDTQDLTGMDGDAWAGAVTFVGCDGYPEAGDPFVAPPIEFEIQEEFCDLTAIYFKGVYRPSEQGCGFIPLKISQSLINYLCPLIEILGPIGLCPGETAELLVTPNVWDAYQWSGGITSTNETVTVGPGTFDLMVMDEKGCSAAESITVESFSTPDPVIDIQPNDTICPGDSVSISLSGATYFLDTSGFMLPLRFTIQVVNDTIIPFIAEEDGCSVNDTIFIYTDEIACSFFNCGDLEITDFTNDTFCLKGPPVRIFLGADVPIEGFGVWQGAGIIDTANGIFDPGIVGLGRHPIVFTYTIDTCTLIHPDTVVVVEAVSAIFEDGGTYCRSNGNLDLWLQIDGPGPYSVDYQVDDNLPQSTTPSLSDSVLISIPFNQIDSVLVILGFRNRHCIDTLLGINFAKVIDGIESMSGHICNTIDNTWTPIIELSGDPLNDYTVSGSTGTFSGSLFTGDPISIGSEFNATFSAQSIVCADLEIRLPSPSCICVSMPGSINASMDTITICREESDPINYMQDGMEVLDIGDTLLFIFHNGRPDSIGTIIDWSNINQLSLPTPEPLSPGIYFIQAVAGDIQGDTINLRDGCTAYSNAIPVRIRSFPTLELLPIVYGCGDGFVDIPIPLTGQQPFIVYYLGTDGNERTTSTQTTDFEIGLPYTQDDTFRVTRIFDEFCQGEVFGETLIRIAKIDTAIFIADTCATSVQIGNVLFNRSNPSGMVILPDSSFTKCDSFINVSINFLELPQGFVTATICPLDTVIVNGKAYHALNLSGIDTISNGSTGNCDSIVNINLTLLKSDTSFFSPEICEGRRFVLNGNEFDDSNPIGIVSLPNGAANGCDSFVEIALRFVKADTITLTPTLCWNESIMVNGKQYDANNRTGIEVINTADPLSCDSIVAIQLQFTDTIETFITACAGDNVPFGDLVLNESNPSGVTLIPDMDGCDFLYNVSVLFLEDKVGELIQTLCPGEVIDIGGMRFDEGSPVGSVRLIDATSQGCDSIVQVELFYTDPELLIEQTICTGTSITVQGMIYDASNPKDSIIIPGGAFMGCDSLIVVNLSFQDSIVNSIISSLCVGESILIGTQLFDETNPTGRILFENGSVRGCDSIVTVELNYLLEVVDTFDITICPMSSLVVNGFEYNIDNPQGVETFIGGANNGCDSVLFVNLEFAEMAPAIQARVVGCDGNQDRSVYIGGINSGIAPYEIIIDQADTFQVTIFPFQVYVAEDATTTSVEINDQAGCSFVEVINFQNDSTSSIIQLVGEQEILLGQSTTIAISANFPLNDYTLIRSGDDSTCVNCLPITIMPLETVSYKAVATGINGCVVEDIITIRVDGILRIYVPNIFSPNSDGLNDDVRIYPGQNLTTVHSFRIFDYWGELLFSAEDYYPDDSQPTWDGTLKGQFLDPGVFPYVLEASFINGERKFITGSITLVR